MTTVNLELPEEVFSARRQPPEEFVRDMRLAAAIYWYQKGEISQEKAATEGGGCNGSRLELPASSAAVTQEGTHGQR